MTKHTADANTACQSSALASSPNNTGIINQHHHHQYQRHHRRHCSLKILICVATVVKLCHNPQHVHGTVVAKTNIVIFIISSSRGSQYSRAYCTSYLVSVPLTLYLPPCKVWVLAVLIVDFWIVPASFFKLLLLQPLVFPARTCTVLFVHGACSGWPRSCSRNSGTIICQFCWSSLDLPGYQTVCLSVPQSTHE